MGFPIRYSKWKTLYYRFMEVVLLEMSLKCSFFVRFYKVSTCISREEWRHCNVNTIAKLASFVCKVINIKSH